MTAGRGASIPLKDVFDQPETMWMQFRRRLDCLYPYCWVASHTEGEVRNILLALEHIYRPSFPALNLQQWTEEFIPGPRILYSIHTRAGGCSWTM